MEKCSEGGCLCGAIRYQITGAPTVSSICHCKTCRRATGAPVVAWITVPAASLNIIEGQPNVYLSSAGIRRTFCASCGTALTYSNHCNPETIDVTTCSLDKPESFPPTYHEWVSHDLNWCHFSNDIPKSPASNIEN